MAPAEAQRQGGGPRIRLNREVLTAVLAVAREVEEMAGVSQRLDALLSVRGVLDVEEGGDPALQESAGEAIERSLGEVLDRLASARREEGERLAEIFAAQLSEIDRLIKDASAAAALRPEAIRLRLEAAIQQILQVGAALQVRAREAERQQQYGQRAQQEQEQVAKSAAARPLDGLAAEKLHRAELEYRIHALAQQMEYQRNCQRQSAHEKQR